MVHKEDLAPTNWCFQIVVLEKTLESPLYCKEIQPVNPKGNQPWIFIERTDAKTEAPVLWPPYVKSQHIGKEPEAGKDWRQKEKEGYRGWDGWMASLTQWTWVWRNSGRYWRIRKPGMLQFLGSQRARNNLVTEQQQEIYHIRQINLCWSRILYRPHWDSISGRAKLELNLGLVIRGLA